MAEVELFIEPNPHWMRRLTSLGLFIKKCLMERGPSCQVDVHRQYREYLKITYGELGRDLPPGRKGTYHSFCQLFHIIKSLDWVQPTGEVEKSRMQEYYAEAPPRIFYELTLKGKRAGDSAWRDPIVALYGYKRQKRSGQLSTIG